MMSIVVVRYVQVDVHKSVDEALLIGAAPLSAVRTKRCDFQGRENTRVKCGAVLLCPSPVVFVVLA